jgi:hypothetical protein
MTESIMKVWAAADHMFDKPMWLEKFDVDAEPSSSESFLFKDGALVNGVNGGRIWLTGNRDAAHKFASVDEVFATWNTVSKTRPRRPDGLPNKPLTALSIEVEPVRLS